MRNGDDGGGCVHQSCRAHVQDRGGKPCSVSRALNLGDAGGVRTLNTHFILKATGARRAFRSRLC